MLSLAFVFSFNQVPATSSHFFDTGLSEDNVFSTGYWIPPDVPVPLGWNVRSESAHFSEKPVDIDCGGITDGDFPTEGNGKIAFLWEEVGYYDDLEVKYEKQWLRPGRDPENESHWEGQEKWSTPYTNYRTFGSSTGTEGLWHNRVRATVDTDKDGSPDLYSAWSEGCAVTYDREHKVLENIVLNEFVPNPVGWDRKAMPGGEWVELYNKGDFDIDVAGWFLYDKNDPHELEIKKSNSDNDGNTSDSGETIVPAKGFLVVYRNGDKDFSLNNHKDKIRLFNGEIKNGAVLVDSYSYKGSDFKSLTGTLGDENVDDSSGGKRCIVPPGKSFIRFPDGFDNWIDPIPTPGKANEKDNSEKELIEYYEKVCFEGGEPVCEEDFMKAIGIWEESEETEEEGIEEPQLVSDVNTAEEPQSDTPQEEDLSDGAGEADAEEDEDENNEEEKDVKEETVDDLESNDHGNDQSNDQQESGDTEETVEQEEKEQVITEEPQLDTPREEDLSDGAGPQSDTPQEEDLSDGAGPQLDTPQEEDLLDGAGNILLEEEADEEAAEELESEEKEAVEESDEEEDEEEAEEEEIEMKEEEEIEAKEEEEIV